MLFKQTNTKYQNKMTGSGNIYCTILQASLLCLLASLIQIVPLIEAQQLMSTMQKLKIPDEIVPMSGYVVPITVELNGNSIKPGDPVPAKNFKNLDLKNIKWDAYDSDARYTFMLLDLDRKPGLNGTMNIYNQFTSINIPGNQIGQGQVIVGFDPPSVPCHPSTKHRLLMLAFRQVETIDLVKIVNISAPAGPSPTRENLKLSEIIQRHRLTLEAANVFYAVGEANGICSGSMTIHSLASMSIVNLVSMVILVSTFVVRLSRGCAL